MPARAKFPLLILLLFLVAAAGCGPSDPLSRPVVADSAVTHALWRSRSEPHLSKQQWVEFDEALQELRFQLMREKAGGSSEAVERALHAAIHNRSIREVMIEGTQSRLLRLIAVRDELDRMIKTNSRLRTKPGDRESQDYLNYRRNDQTDRLEQLQAEILAMETRLAKLKPVQE